MSSLEDVFLTPEERYAKIIQKANTINPPTQNCGAVNTFSKTDDKTAKQLTVSIKPKIDLGELIKGDINNSIVGAVIKVTTTF